MPAAHQGLLHDVCGVWSYWRQKMQNAFFVAVRHEQVFIAFVVQMMLHFRPREYIGKCQLRDRWWMGLQIVVKERFIRHGDGLTMIEE